MSSESWALRDGHSPVPGSERASPQRVRGEATSLVMRARGGDDRALDALMARLYPTVRAFVHRMTRPGEASLREDLVQASLEQLCLSMDRFEERSRFSTFVYGVCFRVISRRRSKDRVRALFQRQARDEAAIDDPRAEENHATDARWAKHLVEQLSHEERTAFVLYVCEQLSLTEVAEITGKSLATVKRRLKTAREKLMALGGEP